MGSEATVGQGAYGIASERMRTDSLIGCEVGGMMRPNLRGADGSPSERNLW